MPAMSVSILLALRDQLTAPARNASRSFNQMGQQMRTASAQITAGANRSASAVNRLGTAANMASASIGRLATNMRNMRTLAAGFTGLGLGGGAGMIAAFPLIHMVKNAADYETAIFNIRKIWVGAEDDFERAVAGLRKLNKEIPLSRTEIAKLMEEGTRAGIGVGLPERSWELLAFTRTAAEFATAFQLQNVDTAATMLAKIKSSLGLTIDEFVAVGDQMNTLAAMMPTSEHELLHTLRRAGSMAKTVAGMEGVRDIIAIFAGLTGAGVQPEIAATAVTRFMARISQMNKPTRKALGQLGLTPLDVQKRMVTDIFGTFDDVLRRTLTLPKHEQLGILSELAGMRTFEGLGRILGNVDLLREGLDILLSDKRITMASEFERRITSLNSAFLITRNVLGELQDSIVMAWRPQIAQLLSWVRQTANAMEGSKILQWTAAVFAGLAGLSLIALPFGILGASLFSVFLGFKAIGAMLRGVVILARPLLGILQGIARGLAVIGPELAAVARAGGLLAAVFAGLRLLALGTGVGAAITALILGWDGIKAIVSGFWSGLRSGWEGSEVQAAFTWLASVLPGLATVLRAIGDAISAIFSLSFENSTLVKLFDDAAAAANVLLNPLQSIKSLMSSLELPSIFGGSGGKEGALAGAAAGAGRFATLPQGTRMPPSIGSVTNNVTVNVSQTNASPEAIGAAAANAIGNKVRGALSDAPSSP